MPGPAFKFSPETLALINARRGRNWLLTTLAQEQQPSEYRRPLPHRTGRTTVPSSQVARVVMLHAVT